MRLTSVLCAAALLVAGCGGGSTESAESAGSTQTTGSARTSEPAQTTATTRSTGSAATVPDFLDFTAETIHGEQVAGADYAGQDLVLWFWAPW